MKKFLLLILLLSITMCYAKPKKDKLDEIEKADTDYEYIEDILTSELVEFKAELVAEKELLEAFLVSEEARLEAEIALLESYIDAIDSLLND